MDNASRSPFTATSVPTPPIASDEVDWTGQVLGQFRLLHRLGRGGMGQVYLAEQINLKRKVALKLLHSELAANERALLRFKAEAENVARATHANIVQIYDIGKDNGVNWLALEYVEGKNLREFIEKKGTPELPLGLHIMMQVASALQRASELGIIHRDIKPENILLTKKGDVKVADFGLSRCFAEEGQQTITQSQVTMGTPLYMSPEQVERKTVDTRTDIYSFGVTCYHMFAGTPPFRGTSPIEVAYQHVHKDPQPLAEIRPDLPADLCAIIQKMMAKRPEDRYQNAREIMRHIDRLREALNLGAVAAISISSSFLSPGSDALRGSATQTWPEAPTRSPWIWRSAVAVSVVLALAGGLVLGWYQQRRQQLARSASDGLIAPPDDPGQVKKPVLTKEDEKEMQRQVQKYLNPTNSTEVVTGLQHSVELSLYYLNEKRLDDADQLFMDLRKPERNPAYRFLGRLGHAMTLAFKDEPAASNQEFLVFFGKIERIEARGTLGVPIKGLKKDPVLAGEIEMYKHVWKPRDLAGHPDPKSMPMREMAAKALNHNYANDPGFFAEKQPAEKLNAYRFPPRPTLKAPVLPP
jgi:eukaryotic-like serine/threonine-protein kinase